MSSIHKTNDLEPIKAQQAREICDDIFLDGTKINKSLLKHINEQILIQSKNGDTRYRLDYVSEKGTICNYTNGYPSRCLIRHDVLLQLKDYYEKFGYTLFTYENENNEITDAWLSWKEETNE